IESKTNLLWQSDPRRLFYTSKQCKVKTSKSKNKLTGEILFSILSFTSIYDSITSNTSYKTLEKFEKIYILELEWTNRLYNVTGQFPDEEYADQRSKIKKVRMKTQQQRRIVHQNLMLAFFQIHMRMSFISITGNQIDLFTPQPDQTICGL
ncbi:hypothetical protein HID58_006066, partial [Brassica napus]